MSRPAIPIQLIKNDNSKSHKTKAEIAHREKAEQALLTGEAFEEWDEVKKNTAAHKEFVRLKKLFKIINHDDGLHEGIINRYCLILAECKEFEAVKVSLYKDFKALNKAYDNGEIDFLNSLSEKDKIQNRIFTCDTKIMQKRKMMLDIEKENIMTIASALRSIPKKPQEQEESNPMAAYMNKKS